MVEHEVLDEANNLIADEADHFLDSLLLVELHYGE
jgi:hypothetical protein